MRIAVIGTSNSIMANGWLPVFKGLARDHHIDNLSLGACPAIHMVRTVISRRVAAEYDLCILEIGVNDQRYMEAGHLADATFAAWLAETLAQFGPDTRCRPMGLLLPTHSAFNVPGRSSRALEIARRLCDHQGVNYVDIKSDLDKTRRVFDSNPYDAFLDWGHLLKEVQRIVAFAVFRAMSHVQHAKPRRFPSPGYSIVGAEAMQGGRKHHRKNRLIDIDTIVLEPQDAMEVEATGFLCGITHWSDEDTGYIAVQTGNGSRIKSLKKIWDRTLFITDFRPPIPTQGKFRIAASSMSSDTEPAINQAKSPVKADAIVEIAELIFSEQDQENIGADILDKIRELPVVSTWIDDPAIFGNLHTAIKQANLKPPSSGRQPKLQQALAHFARRQWADAALILQDCPATAAVRRLQCQVFLALGKPSDALKSAIELLNEISDDPSGLFIAASASAACNNWADTVKFASRLLESHPDHSDGRLLLARALINQGTPSAAVPHLEQVIAGNPKNVLARLILARLSLAFPAMRSRAEELARAVIHARPTEPAGHQILGEILLRRGCFGEGWDEYSWRQQGAVYRKSRRPFNLPTWHGEDLSDNKLLVIPLADQGLGIEVLCATMYDDLLALARNIVVESSPRLADLLRDAFPTIEFVPLRDPPAPRLLHADIVVQATVFDLARVLRRRNESFQRSRPFLKNIVKQSGSRRPIIGLSWKSSTNFGVSAEESVPLCWIAEMLREVDAELTALQYGDFESELRAAEDSTGIRILPPAADFEKDLDAFASAVAGVDLVISIENSTVHFAGAMGKPCWLLAPENCLWIWGDDRADGLWYRSVRIFRAGPQGWRPLLLTVREQLQEWRRTIG